MPTTSNRGYPYPTTSDRIAEGPAAIQALAEAVDLDVSSLLTGYRLLTIVSFTSSGVFVKNSYPGMRAAIVEVQAPGGGSGGVGATGANQGAAAGGGGGGEYRKGLILASSLSASETVTIGARGAAAAAGANAGGQGGTTSFGSGATLLQAVGGSGGAGCAAQSGRWFVGAGNGGSGGSTGAAWVWSISIPGQPGNFGQGFTGQPLRMGNGGASVLSAGPVRMSGAGSGGDGVAGLSYGGGASGAVNEESQSARPGALGGPGIVIVHVYV